MANTDKSIQVTAAKNNSLSDVEFDTSHVSTDLDRIYELDVLSQFKTNLAQVENLSRRLKFVLGEVSQLINK